MPTTSNVNAIVELVPYGQLVTRQWLAEMGWTRHSLDYVLKSGKLVSLAKGVFARPEIPVTWQGVLASLKRMYPEPVYLGGSSALELAGYSHYLRVDQPIELYSQMPCPTWLPKIPLNKKLRWHSTRRLWKPELLQNAVGLRERESELGWSYLVALPEHAFLETLMDVPKKLTFEQADQLMQGLTSLPPTRLDVVLKGCCHIRVKRLFFFLADRYDYAWRLKLDSSQYDLGSGKRVVAAGGKLDKRYLITVPEEFQRPEAFHRPDTIQGEGEFDG